LLLLANNRFVAVYSCKPTGNASSSQFEMSSVLLAKKNPQVAGLKSPFAKNNLGSVRCAERKKGELVLFTI